MSDDPNFPAICGKCNSHTATRNIVEWTDKSQRVGVCKECSTQRGGR